MFSREEQLGIELTIEEITNTIFDNIGNRKI